MIELGFVFGGKMNYVKRGLLPVIIVLIICFGPFSVFGDVKQLIAEGDTLYQERADLANAYKAFEAYKKAAKLDEKSYEAQWKVGKAAFYIAEMEKDKDKKWKVVDYAIDCGKKAVKLKPESVEGHFWLGVCYTKVGEIKGILKALFLIKPIKQEMSWVISRNNKYEGGSAYTVLARVYALVPPLIGGDKEKALKFYKKAHGICPANSLNLLFMAENYWNMDKKKLAIKTLETLTNLTADPRWIPETKKNKKAGSELLSKYKAELNKK